MTYKDKEETKMLRIRIEDTEEKKIPSDDLMKEEDKNGIDGASLTEALDRATDPFTADGAMRVSYWRTDGKELSREDNLDEERDPND